MSEDKKELKRCSKCGCTILLKFYSINRKGEYYKTCDRCRERRKKYREENKEKIREQRKEQDAKYYQKNKDEINKKRRERSKDEEFKKKKKEYYKENIEKIKEREKQYYEDNKEKIKEIKKQYRENNREKIAQRQRKYVNNRIKTDPVFRVTRSLRRRLYKAVKNNLKSKSTMELLGCTGEEVKEHLEKQFTEGMSWDNYGEWHIDHIKPCCSFDMSDPEQQKICFHYSNLQPLWAEDNLKKGGSIIEE